MRFFKINGDHVTVDYVQNHIYWLMVIWRIIKRWIEVTCMCMFWRIISIERVFFFENRDFEGCHRTNEIFKVVWFLQNNHLFLICWYVLCIRTNQILPWNLIHWQELKTRIWMVQFSASYDLSSKCPW